MFIKLTERIYLNPESVSDVEHIPKGTFGGPAFFTVRHHGSHLHPIEFSGEEAELAFANWKAAHEARESEISTSNSVTLTLTQQMAEELASVAARANLETSDFVQYTLQSVLRTLDQCDWEAVDCSREGGK